MKTPPRRLVSVLKTALEGMEFPAEYDGTTCPFAGQPLFDAVKVFDLDDMVLAFEELLVFKKRAAFIVLTEEQQTVTRAGTVLSISFHEHFALMISDRSYKNRQLALMGDSTTPGVLLLSDILVQRTIGEIAPGYVCEPGGGEIFAITGEDRQNQIGRIGWRQDLTLHGGRIEKSISREALKTYAPSGV